MGTRLPQCSTRSFGEKVEEAIPEKVGEALLPLVRLADALSDCTRSTLRGLPHDRARARLEAERIATPYPQGSCILYSMPVFPGALKSPIALKPIDAAARPALGANSWRKLAQAPDNINYQMRAVQVFGFVVAVLAGAWASFTFLKGSIYGAPPLYSRGPLRRTLHFVADIIFVALALGASLKLARKW